MLKFLVPLVFLSSFAFGQNTKVEAQFECVNQYQKGFAFNPTTKKAWVISERNSKSGEEIFIYPDEFEVYRCPGCFSFKGFIEIQNEQRQVYAFTHLNTLHHEMWMFYMTQANNGELLQETIPCKELH